MEAVEYNERTCIVVVEIATGAGKLHIGTVVDSVSEVLNIRGHDIEDTPLWDIPRDGLHTRMAKTGGGVKILLDIDQV